MVEHPPVAAATASVPATPGERVHAYLIAARAQSTREAYRRDWADFTAWCTAARCQPLPATPETVAAYLAHLADAGKSVSTINRRSAAIRFAHRLEGHDSPTRHALVETTMAGIRRTLGTAQGAKAAAATEEIRAMVMALPRVPRITRLRVIRDTALLLLGFAGAFRESELVALNVDDLTWQSSGLIVLVRKSKTDQEGEGMRKGIPYGAHPETCPVRALRAWLEVAGITRGPLFRGLNRYEQVSSQRLSYKGLVRAVKAAATAAGLDTARYSGHSLRAGLATAAAAAGVSERIIMQQTGHKSERMVRRYIRDGNLFRENAAGQVGL